jgi:hypothetical protein
LFCSGGSVLSAERKPNFAGGEQSFVASSPVQVSVSQCQFEDCDQYKKLYNSGVFPRDICNRSAPYIEAPSENYFRKRSC